MNSDCLTALGEADLQMAGSLKFLSICPIMKNGDIYQVKGCVPGLELTYAQKRELFVNGYVKIPNVVPKIMIDEALRTINQSLGEGIPPEQLQKFRAQSFCPDIQDHPAITGLFHRTPANELVGSVIELDRIVPIRKGQIALRFPSPNRKPRRAEPHLDGMYSPSNGVKQGTIGNFTALVAVLLSDLPDEHAGNFTVWPKTHVQYEPYFQEHGAEALLNGMPPVPMPEPVQITGNAGDIVIAHYMLAHGVTPNISPHIRYAVFFRVKHDDIQSSNWQESMQSIWMHWPGMKEIISE